MDGIEDINSLLHGVQSDVEHSGVPLEWSESGLPVDYAPAYDEAALDRFAAAGREAWKDISNPSQWVEKLRGGS